MKFRIPTCGTISNKITNAKKQKKQQQQIKAIKYSMPITLNKII